MIQELRLASERDDTACHADHAEGDDEVNDLRMKHCNVRHERLPS
jgi:hypothetical protein